MRYVDVFFFFINHASCLVLKVQDTRGVLLAFSFYSLSSVFVRRRPSMFFSGAIFLPHLVVRRLISPIFYRFLLPSLLSHLLLSCLVLSYLALPCLVQTWRRHPDTLVGFFPRSHSHTQQNPKHNQLRGQQEEVVERGNEGEGGVVGGVWEYLYFWRLVLVGFEVSCFFFACCACFLRHIQNAPAAVTCSPCAP